MAAVDVFLDLSRGHPQDVRAAIARLDSSDSLRTVARQVFCVVPPSFDTRNTPRHPERWHLEAAPLEACSRAMSTAADAARYLLVLLGDVEPHADSVGLLLD